MDLTKCDGTCGKISPDEKDKHIANNWSTVKIVDRRGRFDRERSYIFCDDCFKNINIPNFNYLATKLNKAVNMKKD